MRVAHLLRKYNSREWGGTESAVKRLCDGLRAVRVESVVYCPRLSQPMTADPLAESGTPVKRYRSCLPFWGLSREQREALLYSGGNLLSCDLLPALLREPGLSLIHTHCLNRIGGIGLTAARLRRIPLVVSIHGGALSLPDSVRELQAELSRHGFDWGRPFGALLGSRRVLSRADAIIVFNHTEAAMLRAEYPRSRVVVQPHGVSLADFEKDYKSAALAAFPALARRKVLLVAGRLHPVKNQRWVVEQAPEIIRRFPDALIALAGSCGGETEALRREICRGGLGNSVILTGGLPPGDPRLIGLFQLAKAVILPSLNETFGLVILEAWAARTPVIASRTVGAVGLVKHGVNGWLFDLSDHAGFHELLTWTLKRPALARRMGRAGRERVRDQYDSCALAAQTGELYRELIEERS